MYRGIACRELHHMALGHSLPFLARPCVKIESRATLGEVSHIQSGLWGFELA